MTNPERRPAYWTHDERARETGCRIETSNRRLVSSCGSPGVGSPLLVSRSFCSGRHRVGDMVSLLMHPTPRELPMSRALVLRGKV